MASVKISFLLAVNLKVDEKKRKEKPAKKGSAKSKKSRQNTKSPKRGKKSKPVKQLDGDTTEKPQDERVITVGAPLCYLHLDYELFPKKFKYMIDIICWGTIAKIFTVDGTTAVKTIIKDEICWIPIFIEHYLNPLLKDDILALTENVITFDIKIGPDKVSSKAQTDKSSVFFCYDKDLEDFVEVFPYSDGILPENSNSTTKFMREILSKCLANPLEGEIVTWVNNMNRTHLWHMKNIVEKVTKGEEIKCKEYYVEENEEKAKAKKKTEENIPLNIKVAGETLLTDPILSIYQLKKPTVKMTRAFVLLSSENLLTVSQKFELRPLVLKVSKINNFPAKLLLDKGFKEIYVHCNIPGVGEFQTPPRSLVDSKTVRFDESRIICTHEVPGLKILEILQFRRLKFEVEKIRGIKELPLKQKQSAPILSKASKKPKEIKPARELVTLAMATYDVTSLLKNFWIFKEKGQCHNPGSYVHFKCPELNNIIIDRLTVNEMNSVVDPNRGNPSPLSEALLLEESTTLKIEAYFLAPQFPPLFIRHQPLLYKRFLVIIYQEEVAKSFLNQILLYNQEFRGIALVIPTVAVKGNMSRHSQDTGQTGPTDEKLLSGFLIDDGNNYIFFVEGLANCFILSLIHQLNAFNYPVARIFYNSSHAFGERLCWNFLYANGFFILTLKMPLMVIWEKQKTYLEGNVPIPTWKALQKLNLIIHSQTFTSIIGAELIPTQIELISLSMEYGLQLRYRFKEDSCTGYGLRGQVSSKIF